MIGYFLLVCPFNFSLTMTKQEFVAWADKEITELLKSYSFMKQEFASVMKFYGEDTAKTRIDNFFSTFASFTSEFEVSMHN